MALDRAVTSGRLTPLRIAAIYLVVGSLWIVASDWFVASLPISRTLETWIQTVKGWFFVAGSALLIYVLVARSRDQLHEANSRLRRALQQYSVLHRVLRHNLRNACNVIELKAEELVERTDGGRTGDDRAIERQVEALLSLSEKSMHLRQIALGEQERQSIDVRAIVESEVAAFSQRHPNATVDVDGLETATALGYPEVEYALRELLENAAEHYEPPQDAEPSDARDPDGPETASPEGADGPTIQVGVRDAGDAIEIDVADDGPGLPAMEREVIEQGMETPLSHSEGLGLWIVREIVSESGGDLHLVETEDGTTIRIELPAADRAPGWAYSVLSQRQTV